jgi:hypothetical protein
VLVVTDGEETVPDQADTSTGLDVLTPEKASVTMDTWVAGLTVAVGEPWFDPATVTQAASLTVAGPRASAFAAISTTLARLVEDLGWPVEDLGWPVEDLGWLVEDLAWLVEDLGWLVEDLGWLVEDLAWLVEDFIDKSAVRRAEDEPVTSRTSVHPAAQVTEAKA